MPLKITNEYEGKRSGKVQTLVDTICENELPDGSICNKPRNGLLKTYVVNKKVTYCEDCAKFQRRKGFQIVMAGAFHKNQKHRRV